MDEKKLAELREHYDTTELSGDIATAEWDSETASDPMVVTSLRLPKSLLDWVRAQAEVERVRPTAWIRRLIEDARQAGEGDSEVTLVSLAARVERLESVMLHVARTTPGASTTSPEGSADDSDSMSDLLTALQRSVEAARGVRPMAGDRRRRGA